MNQLCKDTLEEPTTDNEARILAASVGFFHDSTPAMRALEEATALLDAAIRICDDDQSPITDLVTLARARVYAATQLERTAVQQ